MVVLTYNPYSLNDQFIAANTSFTDKLTIPFNNIQVIDNRYDTTKQGFFPVYKSAPRAIRFNRTLSTWMLDQMNTSTQTSSEQERNLIVVIQKFWFNTFTDQRFTPFKQQLKTSLYYKIELFSQKGNSFFALKRNEGVITKSFDETETYSPLVDSVFKKIREDLASMNYQTKEDAKNTIALQDFTGYLFKKAEKAPVQKRIKPGVYVSYNDFVEQRTIGDSVDIVQYKDYFGRQTVACHLGVYVRNFLQSCNKYWGYYDGRYLYVNTGKGLFVRLMPWYNQFVLADLQQLVFTKKRKSFIDEAYISTSEYRIVKDFAKAYHLFFQLDYDDGKLY